MKLKSYLRGLGVGLFISAVLMGIATSGKKETLSDDEIRTRAKALGMVEEDSVLLKPEAGTEESPKPTIESAQDEKTGKTSDEKEAVSQDKAEDKDKPDEDKASEVSPKVEEETGTEDNASEDSDKDTSDGIRGSKEDRAMGGQLKSKDTEEENKPADSKAEENKTADTETEEKTEKKAEEKTEEKTNETFTLQIAKGASSDTVAQLLKKGGAIDNADDFDDYLCKNHYDKKINPGVFRIPVGADYAQIAEIITGN